MPRNIITTPEQSFAQELKKELKGAKSAKFAVGWFFISGLKELKDEADDIYKLYFGDRRGNIISENDWEVLALLECDKDTKNEQFEDEYYSSVELVKQNFQDRANRIERERSSYLELVKRQALDRIEKAKQGNGWPCRKIIERKTKSQLAAAQETLRRDYFK